MGKGISSRWREMEGERRFAGELRPVSKFIRTLVRRMELYGIDFDEGAYGTWRFPALSWWETSGIRFLSCLSTGSPEIENLGD
jgi:hypothetical protein